MTKDHLRSDGLPFADACTKHGYMFGGRTGRAVCPGCQAEIGELMTKGDDSPRQWTDPVSAVQLRAERQAIDAAFNVEIERLMKGDPEVEKARQAKAEEVRGLCAAAAEVGRKWDHPRYSVPTAAELYQCGNEWDARDAYPLDSDKRSADTSLSWRPFLWTLTGILLCVVGVVAMGLIWGMRP